MRSEPPLLPTQPPGPDAAFRFVALGDAGSGLPAQQQIAAQLLAHHDQTPFSLVLLLGDNIYPNGDTLKYGEKRFTQLYQPLLERGVRFRPVLGNHDISGPLGVGYPAFWMSNQKENMRFFNMPAPYYTFSEGGADFFMLNTNHFKPTQRLWLAEQLGKAASAVKIVCGHHPVLSSGFHGSSARLKRRLKPLLEKHNALLYLSAHEHDYERFSPLQGVTYLVSGGGGADLRAFRKPLPDSQVRRSEHHFLSLQLDGARLALQAIKATGQTMDAIELPCPQTPAPSASLAF